VITGGSSGLGLALATELARRRLDVTLLARNRDRLDQARDYIVSVVPGARVRLYAVDVSDFHATRATVDDLTESGQGIDIVINSAGIVREGYFETLQNADFRSVMDVDFVGVLNVARICLPHLKAAKGRIVNVSSMAGLVGVFGQTAYCAAKHAVNGFSEALRLELEPLGITV
jgi:3-dehydrosphinganine reductase